MPAGAGPLQIGFHFVLMNGGAYWRALERFAEAVCNRPEVACVSYSEYLADDRKAAPGRRRRRRLQCGPQQVAAG